MKVRIISAAAGAAVFLAVLWAPPFVFDIFTVCLAATAIFELYRAVGILKIKPLSVSGIFGIALSVLFGLAHRSDSVLLYEVCLLTTACYIGALFAIMIFCHKSVDTKTASEAFFGTMFIALLYSYIFALRMGDPGKDNGIYLTIALFAATWFADGGAYFAGVLFGKHKLAPELSPKKTVEGAVGGVIASVLAMWIYSLLLKHVFIVPCNTVAMMITGFICAILGPVGDIATSAIKREHGIKDYGNLMPGHGGALDRFDSVLLTAPTVFFVSRIFDLIG